jgi:curved DNA-binding protein CbpA
LKLPDFFGGGKNGFLARGGQDAATAERLKRLQTANDFVNVKDARGPVLYGKDGYLFAFLRIQPISLDLLSPREKEKKIKSFAAEFSAEKKGFKFFSISRPVDISGLSARLIGLLAEAADAAQKDLLNHEIREVSAFALNGEVTERQFYLIVWEPSGNDGEKELLRRARELENRFSGCEIVAELCDQGTVIRLLNLFANPNYAHLEDDDVTPAIPMISTNGGRSHAEKY